MREFIPVIRLRTDDESSVVARDGVVISFFMRRSHAQVAPAVWRALEAYQRAIPSHSLAWYVDPNGDFEPLDEKGWEYIRSQMIGVDESSQCRVCLWETPDGAGGYNFEYMGRWLEHPGNAQNPGLASGLTLSLPTEYLLEHGITPVRALALELARELPFSFGYASLAFVSPGAIWSVARRRLPPLLSRYLGMDVYSLQETSRRIGNGARGAYWLTFLGPPLLRRLGGIEGLRQKLPFPSVSFLPLEDERLLVSLGEWPDALDVTSEAETRHVRALARLLEPFFCREKTGFTSMFDTEGMNDWLHRLCR